MAIGLLSTFGVFDSETIVHSTRKTDQIVTCLLAGSQDFVVVTPLPDGGTNVAVLNGKRSALATYTISADGDGSRVIFRRQLVGMTGLHWKECV